MGLSHSPKIVTNGLVLCLDAGNTKSYPGSGTTWSNLSGTGNNGTLTNGPTYSSTNGGSLIFDGINDYTTVASASSLNFSTAIFTTEVWVKITSFPSSSAHNIISKKPRFNNTVKGWQCQLDNRTTGFMQLRTNDGTTLNDNTPTSTVNNSALFTTPTNWLHLVWAVTTGSVRFYINGILNDTQTFTMTAVDNNDALEIGRPILAIDTSPNMHISQVKVYNRQITASEIQQNFNALRGRYGI